MIQSLNQDKYEIQISPENVSVSTEEKQMVITTYHVSIICGINQDTEKRRESKKIN